MKLSFIPRRNLHNLTDTTARRSRAPRPLFPVSYLHDNCITCSIEAVPDGNAQLCPCGDLFVRPQGSPGPANF